MSPSLIPAIFISGFLLQGKISLFLSVCAPHLANSFVVRFSLVDQKEIELLRKITQTILHSASGTVALNFPIPGSPEIAAGDSLDLFKEDSVESFVSPKMAIIGAGWGLKVQVQAFRRVGFQVSAVWTNVSEDCPKIAKEHNISYGLEGSFFFFFSPLLLNSPKIIN
jgi:hypothetical protein